MIYATLHDYLIEQVRKPIEKALEKDDKEEVLKILDFCIYKYEESNAFAKGFEDFAQARGVKIDIPFVEFMQQYVEQYMPEYDLED